MKQDDEPVLGPDSSSEPGAAADAVLLSARVRHLVEEQPYAVLCTHGEEHAYGSLIAFAFADDLGSVAFCTPRAARRYRLLAQHPKVALVIDDRLQFQTNMMDVEAVTATGQAVEVTAAVGAAC